MGEASYAIAAVEHIDASSALGCFSSAFPQETRASLCSFHPALGARVRHLLLYRPFARWGPSMTEACQAAYTGLPTPSLLPRHAEAEEDRPVTTSPVISERLRGF